MSLNSVFLVFKKYGRQRNEQICKTKVNLHQETMHSQNTQVYNLDPIIFYCKDNLRKFG